MAKNAKRETDTDSKLIRELRKKLQRLTSENRQLRKEVRQLRREEEEPEEDEEEMILVPVGPEEKQLTCPKCGAYTNNTFIVVGKSYYKCESCGSKGSASKLV